MRKLEFRTKKVIDMEGGLAQFCTAFDAEADLVTIMTVEEGYKLMHTIEAIIEDMADDKEFIYFTLRGAGRGVRS